MATFFGEIVFDPSPEASDEEDGAVEGRVGPKEGRVEVEWDDQAPTGFRPKAFLLAQGTLASAFASNLVKDNSSQLLATVWLTQDGERIDDAPQKVAGPTLHLVGDPFTALVAICPTVLTPFQAHRFCEQVLPYIQSAGGVHLLMTSHVTSYRCAEPVSNLSTPFLRQLCTSHTSKAPDIPRLEQPNTVCGLPASALTLCEVSRLPATLYINYTDSEEPDSITLEPFKAALGEELAGLRVHTAIGNLADKGNIYV